MSRLPHNHHTYLETQLDQIPSDTSFEQITLLFKQLSDQSRIRIFWILCHYEECVINIAAIMEMTSPAVAHHLKLLRESGLIVSRKEGKEVYYRAADTKEAERLHHMIEDLIEVVCPSQE